MFKCLPIITLSRGRNSVFVQSPHSMNGMSAVDEIIFQVKLEVNLQSLGQKCSIHDFL